MRDPLEPDPYRLFLSSLDAVIADLVDEPGRNAAAAKAVADSLGFPWRRRGDLAIDVRLERVAVRRRWWQLGPPGFVACGPSYVTINEDYPSWYGRPLAFGYQLR